MVTIGVDPHKQTHTGVAADPLGSELARQTGPARQEGFAQPVGVGSHARLRAGVGDRGRPARLRT
jgi:hypothetical protein